MRPASVSATMSQLCLPVWRQSNSAARSRPLASEKVMDAAMGASRFSGNSSVAAVMKTGRGRIWVTMDSALMPGSNTPRPPACQIQS